MILPCAQEIQALAMWKNETCVMLQVMDRIEGRNGLQLPWEGTLPPTVRRKLGIFRNSIMHLLDRDPSQRPSMADFCMSCDRVLAGSTSVQM